MGNEIFTVGSIYMTDPKTGERTYLGESVSFKLTEIPEVEHHESGPCIGKIAEPVEFTAKCVLKFKRVSRKRFVKLMMARGIQRDESNRWADFIAQKRTPYGLARVMFGL